MAKKNKGNKGAKRQQQRAQQRQQRQQERQQLQATEPLKPPPALPAVTHRPEPNLERPLADVLKALNGDKPVNVRTNVIGRLNKLTEDFFQMASKLDVVADRDELKSKHQDSLLEVAEFIRDASVIVQTGVRDIMVAHGRAVFAMAHLTHRDYDALLKNLQAIALTSNEAEVKDLLDHVMKDIDVRRSNADATQGVYKVLGLVPELDADA